MQQFCSGSPSCSIAEFYSLYSMSLCNFIAVYEHFLTVTVNLFHYFLALTNIDYIRPIPIFYRHSNSLNTPSNNRNNIYLNSLSTVFFLSCKLRFSAACK